MKIKTLVIWILIILLVIGGIFFYTYYIKKSPWKALAQNLFTPERTKKPQVLFSLGNNPEDASGLLSGPLGVDADKAGVVYVADTRNNKIKAYDQNGDLVRTIGKEGKKAGELTYPTGVKVLDDQILVTEPLNGRIQIFDQEGGLIKVLMDEESAKEIGGIKPAGIDASPSGIIYVADVLHHRIVMINLSGKILGTFGKAGSEPGDFSYPYDIAFDKRGDVYITDTNNGRVQVFDEKGNFLRIIKGPKDELPFALPRGISFDQYNRLMIVDAFLHQILVFESDGTFLYDLGKRGTGDDELNFPNGIGIGGGRIFVTDRENHRVLVYEP